MIVGNEVILREIDKIEDDLKKEGLNQKEKIDILKKYKEIFDINKPEKRIIYELLKHLKNKKTGQGIRIFILSLLKDIGFDILVLEDYPNYSYDFVETSIFILQDRPSSFIDLITELLELLEIILQGICRNEGNQILKLKRYINRMSLILKEVLELPDKIEDVKLLEKYFELFHRALGYYDFWETKFGKSSLSSKDIWKIIEKFVLKHLSNENYVIRKSCASLIQYFGTDKGEAEIIKAVHKEEYSVVLVQLMEALVQVGFQESRFAFLNVMQRGNKSEKIEAQKCLNALALKLGYLNGNDLISKLAPPNEFSPREIIAMISGIFSSLGTLFTIIGIFENIQENRALIILAIILAIIAILGLVIIPIEFACKKRKYRNKLEEWKIEGYI